MLPIRNYWAPVRGDSAAISDWQAENRRLQRLADAVDIIFPSLYTFYDDPAGWVTYAVANIKEARSYGKPVYAFCSVPQDMAADRGRLLAQATRDHIRKRGWNGHLDSCQGAASLGSQCALVA